MTDMKAALDKYLDAILADYVEFNNRGSRVISSASDEYRKNAIARFKESLRYEFGNKYVKVITGNSVHSFIVLEGNPKFKMGDILKAAGWATPAKNAARGNIFGEYRTLWTGTWYMRG